MKIDRRSLMAGMSAMIASPAIAQYAPPLVQREYYWIPRIPGQSPVFGTYVGVPAFTGKQWISDTSPTNPGVFPLYLPSFVPQRLFITACWLACSSSPGKPFGMSELAAWVDPGGIAYNTANGAEVGSDFTRDISLGHSVVNTYDFREHFRFDPPVLCDRVAGDKLAFQASAGMDLDFVFMGLAFAASNQIPVQ